MKPAGARAPPGSRRAETAVPVVKRRSSRPGRRFRREASADADELLVDELVDAEASELSTEARSLDSAERQLDALGADRVDEYHARLDLVGDPTGLLVVRGEHVRAEAEGRVVGHLDRLLLGRHLVDRGDGAEQFLFVARRVGRDPGQHAWREEGALALALGDQSGTVGDGPLHLVVES